MQLSLFESAPTASSVRLVVCKCNSDWSYALVDGCIRWRYEKFTKHQLLKMNKQAAKRERFRHGYTLFLKYKNENVSIDVRFINETTRKRETTEEFIEKYFPKEEAE